MAEGWRGILCSGGSSQPRRKPANLILAGVAPRFALLPQPKSRWREFTCSLLGQIAGLLLLALASVFAPRAVSVTDSPTITLLVPPSLILEAHPEIAPPPPVKLVAPSRPKMEITEQLSHLRAPRLVAPKLVTVPEIKSAFVPAPVPDSPRPPKPQPEVHIGVLAAANIPLPVVKEPPAKVQTGGFGNPVGQTGEPRPGRLTVDRAGSFDLPPGPGLGNGAGGAKGASGIIVDAGFGKSSPAASPPSTVGSSSVRTGGFGDARTAPDASRKSAGSAPPETVPVEILSKPAPAYTEEARRLRIEGEVLVEVVFTAGGEVRVLRVLQGLGHGLDESAIQAAKQLRFRPARQNGQPVDSVAKLHILFQLAY